MERAEKLPDGLPCLFLSSKVLDCAVSAPSLLTAATDMFALKKTPITVEDLMEGEKTVMEGIGFTFYVHLPYRPLKGLYIDILDWLNESGTLTKDDQTTIESAYQSAANHLDEATFSDLPLMHSPSKIAVAAFLLGMEEQGGCDLSDDVVADGGDDAALDEADAHVVTSWHYLLHRCFFETLFGYRYQHHYSVTPPGQL